MYRIISDAPVDDQIAALPAKALQFCAEAFVVLRLTPESGDLYNVRKPDGLRVLHFGPESEHAIIYLILRDQREVHLLRILWVDLEQG